MMIGGNDRRVKNRSDDQDKVQQREKKKKKIKKSKKLETKKLVGGEVELGHVWRGKGGVKAVKAF